MRLVHKGLLLVSLPLLQAALVIAGLFFLIVQTDQQRFEEARQRKIAELGSTTLMTLYDAGYCVGHILLNDDEDLKGQLKQDVWQLRHTQDRVAELDPASQKDPLTVDIDRFSTQWMETMQGIAASLHGHRASLDSLAELGETKTRFAAQSYDLLWRCHLDSSAVLKSLADAPRREEQSFRSQASLLIGAVLCSIATALMLARWFATDISARLRTITDNTMRLSREEALNPAVPGSDEIANLDAAFHAMASELREANAKERALFETSTDLICILDANFCLVDANPAFERISGFRRAEKVGTNLLEMIHPEDRPASLHAFDQLKQSNPAAVIENRLEQSDGKTIDLAWSLYWSDLDQALYAVAHDISERRQVEREKQEFFHMISHDLRSPLTSIYGSYQLLGLGIFGKLPGHLDAQLKSVLTNSNRLIGLINDLLDIGKLEAGKLAITREDCSMRAVIDKAIEEVAERAAAKNIRFVVDSTEQTFSLDAERVSQACANLLAHAIRFSAPDSAIKISTLIDNDALRVTIEDEACPFSTEDLAFIFDRKRTVRASGAGEEPLGLGLPLCKYIIEAHAGTISASQQEQGAAATAGTKFAFTIPAGTPQPKALPVPVIAAKAQVIPPAPRNHTVFSWFSDMPLFYKGAVLVAIPVLFEIAFAACLFPLLRESYVQKQQEMHQRVVATAANDMFLDYFAIGFSMQLTPPQKAWSALNEAVQQLTAREDTLMKITDEQEEAGKILREIHRRSRRFMRFIKRAQYQIERAGVGEQQLEEAFEGQEHQFDRLSRLGPLFQALIDTANKAGDEYPRKIQELREKQATLLAGGLLANLLICLASVMLFSKGIVKRLAVTADNVVRLKNDQDLQPELRGKDEVGSLDRFFHTMAAALREAHKKEGAVFDNAQDVLLVLNADGTVARVNPALERSWGYSSSEMLSRPWSAMFTEDSADAAAQVLADVRAAKSSASYEGRITDKNGSLRHVSWAISWNDEERCLIAIGHDISARKEFELLNDDFIRLIGKDMERPLQLIAQTTRQLLNQADGLPEKAGAQLQGVLRNCDRLLRLTAELLELQTQDKAKKSLALRAVQPQELLQIAADALCGVSEQKHIKLVCRPCDEPAIHADRDRLVQVLTNLVANALKFSPENSTITLSAQKKGDAVEFSVQDEGRGIPAERRELIFQKYGQAVASDGARNAGTGLGLTICKQIVEEHGGVIGVDASPVGSGTVFFFQVPRRPVND